MKTILYLTNSPIIGGAELSLLSHLKYLDKNKYKPILLCSDILEQKAREINGVEVISMQFYLLHRLNLNIITNYIKMVRKVLDIVNEKNVDIIHTNSVKAHYIGIMVSILTGKKLILWMRDETINKFIYFIFRFIPHKIIFISNYLRSLFPKSKNAIIIQNGTDIYLKKIEEEKELNLLRIYNPKYKVVILCIERLVRWKGVQVLIQALSNIDKEKYVCLIIGSGANQRDDNEEELKKLVEGKNLKDNIQFLGWRDDVYDFYKISNIFVHPNIKPEPFGLVVIEAMSFGLSVISSDIGGPSEIIENGKDGVLIEPDNISKLKDELEKLIDNKELRERYGKNAREKVISMFNQEIETGKIEKIYESI